jgi:hypothetical protein
MYGMGGSLASMQNPMYKVERDNRIRNGLIENLSRALNTNPENIDVDSGLGNVVTRALLSFQEDSTAKYNYLIERYGEENVKEFRVGNKPSFLIKDGDKELLVDEFGASFGDIADLARGGLVLTAEMLVGGRGIGNVRKFPIAARSLGAGAGVFGAEVASEGIEAASSEFVDFEAGSSVLNPLGDATLAMTVDYGFSKPLSFAAKAFTKPGVGFENADMEYENFLGALKRLKESQGIDVPTTPAMRAGTDLTRREELVAAETRQIGLPDELQNPVVRSRMATNDALQAIITKLEGGEVDFNTLSRIGRENYEELAKQALDAKDAIGEQAASAVSKYFNNLAENVSPSLNRRTTKEIGSELEETTSNIFNASKRQVDELYDTALSMGDDVPGLDMLAVAKQMINSLDALGKDLPQGETDKIIRSFFPKSVIDSLSQAKDLSKEARARLRKIKEFKDYEKLSQDGDQMLMFALFDGIPEVANPGEPLQISFRQMVNAKKQLNKLYGKAGRSEFVEKEGLRVMADVLDNSMEGMARNADSDAFDALKEANALWKERQLPMLEDKGLQSILQGNKLRPNEVTEALLNSQPGSVQRLINLRNASPDPEAFNEQIRQTALDQIFASAENQSDELLNTGKLLQLLKKNDFVDEFFDKTTVRQLGKIFNVTKNNKNLLGANATPNITSNSLRQLLSGENLSKQDKAILIAKVRDEAALSQRKKAIDVNQALINLRAKGSGDTTNMNSTMNALLNLPNASSVDEFFSLLDGSSKEQVRARVRAIIFDGASDGAAPRTGEAFGGSRLPDVNSSFIKQLRKKTSTEREVAEAILGKDGLQDVLDVITVLDRMGTDAQQVTTGLLKAQQAQVIGRGGSAQRNFMPRVIFGFDTGKISNKFLGMAMANEKFINSISKGDVNSTFRNMLPFIYGSDNALEILMNETAEDPGILEFLDLMTDGDLPDNRDLLNN